MNLPLIKPQLASTTLKPPNDDHYIHEVKHDGYRIIAYLENNKIRIHTRNGHNWTHKFPYLVSSLNKFKLKNAIFDGEIVVINNKSRSDFQLLQNAIHKQNDKIITYYIFDLLYLNNTDLRKIPLIKRKQILTKLFRKNTSKNVSLSHYNVGGGKEILSKAYKFGLEGIMSKKIDSPYLSGRNKHWLKCKCFKQDEFIMVGYISSRKKVTSFLLAEKVKNKLKYCGRISADFMNLPEMELNSILKDLRTTAPIDHLPSLRNVTWLKPHIYLLVKYTEKTQDGSLRQAMITGIKKIIKK